MLLLLLLSSSAACAASAHPGQLLDAYRVAASASTVSRGTAVSRYTYRGAGMEGDVRSTVDLDTGMYRYEQHSGMVAEEEGFDGSRAWARDLSRFVKPQDGGNRPQLAVSEAYRNANRWWRRDRGGATLESIGCGGIRVAPAAGEPFDAWFDPTTHLLIRVREMHSFGTVVETMFADYQRRAGRLLPMRIERTYGDDPHSTEALLLTHVSIAPARRAAAYTMPRANPHDWRLPPGGQVRMAFQLLNNHIIVEGKIDGHGPFPLLVDSGGHDILTPSALAALALKSQGSEPASGAGENAQTSGYARVKEIDAGGAVLVDQTVVTLDFSPREVEGLQLGGMLGVEFLERFVVQIDYEASTLTLIDAKGFEAAQAERGAIAIPIKFYAHMPQINGAIDGRSARWNIDTGARDEVTLTSPFVAANALRYAYPGGVEMTTGWGVGGPSRAYAVRAGRVALGSATIERPVINLSSAKHGSFSDADYDGNVGSGLLKRFVTTFDYAHQMMYLAPIAPPEADVGRLDRVGMWLNLGERGLKVMDLVPGGPAEQAGLEVGDLVTAIDAVPFDRRSLSATRQLLRLAPLSVPLEVRYLRGSVESVARILPRNLIAD
jgi:hypothetical protein